MDGPGVLSRLHVVEAAEGISAAYAGKLLRDQGADVVKIERVDGDPLRAWVASAPDEPAAGTGVLYQFLHAGKALVSAGDESLVTEKIAAADAIIVGPTTAELIDEEVLRGHRRADASLVSVSPFGPDGPLAGVPADEFTLQAWCGLMSGCGTPTTPPLQMGIGHGQWATGTITAISVLAASEYLARTGHHADFDVSALEVMAMCLTNYPPLYRQFTGSVSLMSRSGDWPSVVRCRDGWIGLCVFTAQQWADFAAMIGRDDLSHDDRLNSMGGRSRNRELAQSIVRPWLEEHTASEIHELCGLFRVPVAFVGNGRDVLEMSHFRERGVFVPGAGDFLQPRSPIHWHLSAKPSRATHAVGAPPPVVSSGHLEGETRARPLDGIRVLDFTAFWAGPAATHLLATLGADVVKVESPTRPDGMRFASVRPPTDPNWIEFGPTFHGTNPGKRSVGVDFSTPEGRDLVLSLVEHFDVVVENFSPRVMANVGLDYEALAARRADLIMLRMPAFGLDGPWRDYSGFAQTTEQVSGIAWLTGEADGEPLVRSTVDPIAGAHGAFAVLCALEHRRCTGEGALIELPMVEVALNVAAEPILTWSGYGSLLERQGNRGARGAPQGVYACEGDEQWVAISVTTDAHWTALREALGGPEWMADPALVTRAGRRERLDDIDRELGVLFVARDRDQLVETLLAVGVPAAPVWPQMVQDELPQLADFNQWIEHPVAGLVGHPGTGMHSPQIDLRYRGPAPMVGQHTDEVLLALLGEAFSPTGLG